MMWRMRMLGCWRSLSKMTFRAHSRECDRVDVITARDAIALWCSVQDLFSHHYGQSKTRCVTEGSPVSVSNTLGPPSTFSPIPRSVVMLCQHPAEGGLQHR